MQALKVAVCSRHGGLGGRAIFSDLIPLLKLLVGLLGGFYGLYLLYLGLPQAD